MLNTIYFFVMTIIYFIYMMIFKAPRTIGMDKRTACKYARDDAGRKWSLFLVKITRPKSIDIIYKGKAKEMIEAIPEDEPVVLVGNHQSYLDVPLVNGYFPIPMAFVAKKEMETWPLISFWMKKAQSIFLDRSTPRAGMQSIKKAIAQIKDGYSCVIFPEGTRSHDGKIHEFKKGSFKLAIDPKCKLIPVTIKGTYETLNKVDNKLHFGQEIKLIIDEPIETKDLDRERLKALNEEVRQIIVENYEKY